MKQWALHLINCATRNARMFVKSIFGVCCCFLHIVNTYDKNLVNIDKIKNIQLEPARKVTLYGGIDWHPCICFMKTRPGYEPLSKRRENIVVSKYIKYTAI